eukprot:6295946-Prymnesium_polylepis.2
MLRLRTHPPRAPRVSMADTFPEFRAGKFEGLGTYHHADGCADASRFVCGEEVGVGVSWAADRSQ